MDLLKRIWNEIRNWIDRASFFEAEVWWGTEASAFDHDKSGRVGGSLPASERGLDELRDELRALWDRDSDTAKRKIDMRWGEKTLRKKIEAARENVKTNG